MPPRTQAFQLLPWIGGVNSSLDPSMIPFNQLVKGDNIVFGVRGSRLKRDGINFNWDNAAGASNSIIGGLDYWYGVSSKTQIKLTVSDNKSIYKYTSGGTRSTLTADSNATAWGSAVTAASCIVFNNQALIAVDGANNVLKRWDGTNKVADVGNLDEQFPASVSKSSSSTTKSVVYASDVSGYFNIGNQVTIGNSADATFNGTFYVTSVKGTTITYTSTASTTIPASVSRTSVGTTKTITFASSVTSIFVNGSSITVSGAGVSTYNGTYTITGVSGSTITYTGGGSTTESGVADTGITVVINSIPDTGLTTVKTSTAPLGSILQQHLGRVWTNDKTNLDRIHYSTTGNSQEWQGIGDSGSLDIGAGDGDPSGITAIFPTFKGELFVAKQTKLYRVLGDAPENFQVIQVSSGIGCVSHSAVTTVDNDDIVFVSERGVHSLQATNAYGDFESTFVSKDIQKTFNTKWQHSRLKYIWAAYLSNLNSIAFAVTDTDLGTTYNNRIWLYNFDQKAWYSWSNLSCQSIFLSTDSDQKRIYLGTNDNRLAKTQNNTNYDISTSNANTAILFGVKTGVIYMDAGPYVTKAFKKFSLVYVPQGNHTITVNITIDNFAPQALAFSQVHGDPGILGSTLTLGTSSLGYSVIDSPYTQSIDGYGRGFQVEIIQSGITEQVEIQGFVVEYETVGTQQETR